MRTNVNSKTICVLFIVSLATFLGGTASGGDVPFSIAVYRSGDVTLDGSLNLTTVYESGYDGYYFNGHWGYEYSSPGWHDRNFPKWAEACAANNMTFIAGQYYTYGRGLSFPYSTAVDQFGNVESTTPSPVSTGWWKSIMEPGAVHIANMSLYYPIWGVVWDMELYDHDAFKAKYYSFDDEAITGFANHTSREIPYLPPGERRDWLRDNGLLEEFQEWEWNMAYELAKGVADKVHAINPDLVLGFFPLEEDAWFHWAILKGFGTPEAPAAAWTGWHTYGGITKQMADSYKAKIEEYGIHADFIVGIGGAVFSNFEESVRYCDGIWVYSFGTFSEHFQNMGRAIRKYVYFDQSKIDILPPSSLGPDLAARPYRGPGGQVSILVEPHEGGKTLVDGVTFFASSGVSYIRDENVTEVIHLDWANPTIPVEDLPCLVFGLDEDDLIATQVEYLRRELEDIEGFYEGIGLGDLPEVASALSDTSGQVTRAALSRLEEARANAYPFIYDHVSPMVSKPGNFTIPSKTTTSFWVADLKISNGLLRQGELYLYEGLRDWYAADEADLITLSAAGAIYVLLLHRQTVLLA